MGPEWERAWGGGSALNPGLGDALLISVALGWQGGCRAVLISSVSSDMIFSKLGGVWNGQPCWSSPFVRGVQRGITWSRERLKHESKTLFLAWCVFSADQARAPTIVLEALLRYISVLS